MKIALDCWMLGVDACTVIGQRLPRLMTGDAAAMREANLMVSEKVQAAAALQWKMMTGGLGQSGAQMIDGSLRHYGRAVRKNKRRLSRRVS